MFFGGSYVWLRHPQERERKSSSKRKEDIRFNLVGLKLQQLTKDGDKYPEDRLKCANCPATFSWISTIFDDHDGTRQWRCRFCENKRNIDFDDKYVPKNKFIDVVVEQAVSDEIKQFRKYANLVVFCIDTSSSMHDPMMNKPSGELKDEEDIEKMEDDGGEHLKLDLCFDRIKNAVKTISKESPDTSIVYITFDESVTIYWDKSTYQKIDEVDDCEKLEEAVRSFVSGKSESHVNLDTLDFIKEQSQNQNLKGRSLGSALVAASALVESVHGLTGGTSQIVVTTDGEANHGIAQTTDISLTNRSSIDVYKQYGKKLKENKSPVSYILLRSGNKLSLEITSIIPTMTKGQIKLVEDVESFTEDPIYDVLNGTNIIATDVNIRLLTSTYITLKHNQVLEQKLFEAEGGMMCLQLNESYIVNDEEHFFSYDVEDLDDIQLLGSIIPFQAIIKYRKLNGAVNKRFISGYQQFTFDRTTAESEINVDKVGLAHLRQGSLTARQGAYLNAAKHLINKRKFLERICPEKQKDMYLKVKKAIKNLENTILDERDEEKKENYHTRQIYTQLKGELPESKSKSPTWRALRLLYRDDLVAFKIFNGVNMTSFQLNQIVVKPKINKRKRDEREESERKERKRRRYQ